jgi:hypothetical protein
MTEIKVLPIQLLNMALIKVKSNQSNFNLQGSIQMEKKHKSMLFFSFFFVWMPLSRIF